MVQNELAEGNAVDPPDAVGLKPVLTRRSNQNDEESEEIPVSPAGLVFQEKIMDCTIICILGFRDSMEVTRMREILRGTILKQGRFVSTLKLVGRRKRHVWVPGGVDLAAHVVPGDLTPAEAASANPFEAFVARLMSAPPFDWSRPLWEAHVVNARFNDSASACIFRIHHSLGDGTSLMSLLLACTRQADNPTLLPEIPGQVALDTNPPLEPKGASAKDDLQLPGSGKGSSLSKAPDDASVPEPPSKPFSKLSSKPCEEPIAEPSGEPSEEPIAEPGGEPSEEPIAEPGGEPSGKPGAKPSSGPSSKLWGWVASLMLWAAVAVNTFLDILAFHTMLLFVRDSQTPIKGGWGMERAARHMASSRSLSMDDVSMVRKAIKGTVNDVLLAALSGGLYRYLVLREKDDPKIEEKMASIRVRGLTLVNIRPSPGLQELKVMMKGGSRARWGNQMGYITLSFPLMPAGKPLERAGWMKMLLDRKKRSLEALLTNKLCTALLAVAGAQVAAKLTYRALCQSTLALSNMIGPSKPVMLAGNPVTFISPTVVGTPQGLTVHLQSYAGSVRLIANCERSLIPDPQVLCECFLDEFTAMAAAARALD